MCSCSKHRPNLITWSSMCWESVLPLSLKGCVTSWHSEEKQTEQRIKHISLYSAGSLKKDKIRNLSFIRTKDKDISYYGHSNFLKSFLFNFMCMGVLPTCIAEHHVHVWHLQKPEDSVGSPRIGISGGCESPYGVGNWALFSGRATSPPEPWVTAIALVTKVFPMCIRYLLFI